MHISTTRFGSVRIEADDVLYFPHGLVGFEHCRHWVLLADAENEAVGWLQSVPRPDIAMAVVSPRRFLADYHVRLARHQLETIELAEMDHAYVLALVGKRDDRLTLNLRAPLIINLDRRLGCQVVTNDQQPLQYEVANLPILLRKSA